MQDVCSDAEMIVLLRNARQGDAAAYDTLYSLYVDRVFRYLYARTSQRELAEDLAADVFVRMIQMLPRFRLNESRAVASFSAWLYRIAANLLTDEYRKQKHRRHQDLADHPNLADGAPELHRQVVAGEEGNEVMAAIAELGEEQQTVLLFRFAEDYTVGEVAVLMGKTAGAIKALQHRAVANLRRKLASR